MSGYEGRDTEINEGSRSEENAPIKLDLPDIERDAAGIPTFIFKDELSENDKPQAGRKSLEVVMLWREAVMSVGHYNKPHTITIGEHLKNDFRIASDTIPIDRFPLIDDEGGEFVINWCDGMNLEVRDGDGEILNEEALKKRQRIKRDAASDGDYQRSQLVIGLHDRVALQAGELTFVVQFVSPARIVAGSLLKTIDFYFTKVLSLSFLGHLFFVLALLLTPISPNDLSEDLFKNPNRFAQLLLKEPEKAPEPKKKFELSGSKGGGKHKDEEGKFGKPKKEKKDALASTKGAPKVDPDKREKDRKIAMDSGIFKALKGANDAAVSNVLGPGGLGTGINSALGGLRGTQMGDAGGAGGLGMRGTGGGGGGNSLGIGGLGSGTGRGTGGMGDVDLGGRGKGKYKVIPGRTVTKGCLSQQIVGRVINRHSSQIKFCYEKQLQRNPNLAGKVTASWVIGPTGSVMRASISQSTVGDAGVESCIVRVVQRMKFPPCAGGGTADVSYPWIFKPSGG